MRKIAINLDSQKRNASRSLPVIITRTIPVDSPAKFVCNLPLNAMFMQKLQQLKYEKQCSIIKN